MSKEILLNPEMLYNWDFKVDARGYRPQEVDKVLDMVISDYTEYSNIVRKLEKDIKVDEKYNSSNLFNLIDEMYEKKDGE